MCKSIELIVLFSSLEIYATKLNDNDNDVSINDNIYYFILLIS